MNLGEVRRLFVDRNGRFDLVVDTTNYVDNGANFFLQAGQRFLDSVIINRKSEGKYVKDIVTNQSVLVMDSVRSVEEVWIKGDSLARTELSLKSYSWLMNEYGDDFGEKAKGTVTFSAQPSAGETLTIGSEVLTFDTDFDISTVSVVGTISNLVDYINTNFTTITAEILTSLTCVITYEAIGTDGNSVAFTTTSSSISLDGSGYLGGTVEGRVSGVSTGAPNYFTPLISTPYPGFNLANMGSVDTLALMFGEDRFSKDGILILPPADQTYTVTVKGKFFSVLSGDRDVSYHSEMYPELLLMAGNMMIEVFFRNSSGVKDWFNSMQPVLKGISKDLIYTDMKLAGNQLRG